MESSKGKVESLKGKVGSLKGKVGSSKGKGKGKEAETKEEVLDGHSWARKYMPKNGFWGC